MDLSRKVKDNIVETSIWILIMVLAFIYHGGYFYYFCGFFFISINFIFGIYYCELTENRFSYKFIWQRTVRYFEVRNITKVLLYTSSSPTYLSYLRFTLKDRSRLIFLFIDYDKALEAVKALEKDCEKNGVSGIVFSYPK